MVSSDAFYFMCLGLGLTSAVGYPWMGRTAIRSSSVPFSFATAFTGVFGFLCTLPFARTSEMPWLPYIGGGYFVAVTLALVFIALGRLQDPANSPRGFEPVVRSIDELRK